MRSCGLRCRERPLHDPLLSGAHAVLDPEAKTIWFSGGLAPSQRRLILAHEFAHFWLHHAQDAGPCAEEDFEQITGDTLVGYGPRQRREAEANVFAREFLLPGPLLRCWFRDEGLDATAIARRADLDLPTVLSQLAASLIPESPERESAGTSAPPLDPSQQAAANAPLGPLLVGAGPGTGKTRTLTTRVLYLTREQGVAPDELLVLTFARRAAEEMRERIGREAPDIARRAFIGTFHSYGLDLLRRHWQAAGLPPRPVLLDPVDLFTLLEKRIAGVELQALSYLHDPAYPLPDILRFIARAKEDLMTSDELARRAAGEEKLEDVARIWRVYEEVLRERGALDFSDLMVRVVRLLKENAAVLQTERARWRHILVDEYQDVNPAGARLVRLLAGEGVGLWAVGDLRQAIYAFRGASPANIARFESDYPSGRRTELGVNYRSRAGLVTLFGATCGEGPAAWQAARSGDTSMTLAVASDDRVQAEGIAQRIRAFRSQGYAFRDQAILCRTRAQAAALRAGLTARNIPVMGGDHEPNGFWNRPGIKDLLALLSCACEPDGPAFHRLSDLPPDLTACRDAWELFAHALFGPIGLARRITDPAAAARLLDLAATFRQRSRTILDENEEPRRAFLRHVRRMARLGAAPGGEDAGRTDDAVHVLTVHAAKGLEFPVVFVPNLSRGKFPSQSAPSLLPALQRDEEPDEASEEARLFFVAVTRARDHLVLSRAEKYNNRRAEPSPLLACLEGVPGLRHETWTAEAAAPPEEAADDLAAGAGDDSVPTVAPPEMDAGAAELYGRCPRRFYYERIVKLPTGETPPYAAFKRVVRDALASDNPAAALPALWAERGPEPAHPHAPFYRRAAEEIVAHVAPSRERHNAGATTPLRVTLENGVVAVRPDAGVLTEGVVQETFRKPPKDGKIDPEPRLALLRTALEQQAPDGAVTLHLRFLRTGDLLPVPPDRPKQREKHLAGYDRALRGIRLQIFAATPADPGDCPLCPYFFICPS